MARYIDQPNFRPHEAAKKLSVSPSTLARLRLVGGGPRYVKAGRLVLYPATELDRWLAARLRVSTSTAA